MFSQGARSATAAIMWMLSSRISYTFVCFSAEWKWIKTRSPSDGFDTATFSWFHQALYQCISRKETRSRGGKIALEYRAEQGEQLWIIFRTFVYQVLEHIVATVFCCWHRTFVAEIVGKTKTSWISKRWHIFCKGLYENKRMTDCDFTTFYSSRGWAPLTQEKLCRSRKQKSKWKNCKHRWHWKAENLRLRIQQPMQSWR